MVLYHFLYMNFTPVLFNKFSVLAFNNLSYIVCMHVARQLSAFVIHCSKILKDQTYVVAFFNMILTL